MSEVGGPRVKSKNCVASLSFFLLISAFVGTMRAQEKSVDAGKGSPPKFLNMVHQELKPGKMGAYEEMEASIGRIYNRENIPVYWVALESITGPPEMLYLNLYDSSEEMAKAMDAL